MNQRSSSREGIWRAAFEDAPYGIISTDADGRILHYNRAAVELLRPRPLTPLARLDDLLGAAGTDGGEAEARALSVESRRLDTPDGERRLHFLTDRTETERLAGELYYFRTMLDTLPDHAVIAIDRNARIILYNVMSSHYDGLAQEGIVGMHLSELIFDWERDALVKVLRSGEPLLNAQNIYRLRNGRTVRRYGSTYPITKKGETIGAFALIRHRPEWAAYFSGAFEFQKRLEPRANSISNGTRYTFQDIVGDSQAVRDVIERARRATIGAAPVLIYGETGTGKEMFAQSIHNASVANEKPFVGINCAAIPESLIESTLFGTSKGAYTGAENNPGLFELAKDGTLFLDEINSMPIFLQSKLLRVLQEGSVRRLGARAETKVDCRIISSCGKPPIECVEDGTLRADLYYRLSGFSLFIPPLRERREDILPLAESFIAHNAYVSADNQDLLSPEFLEALARHDWKGNVRELKHTIESALVLLEPGERLEPRHLPPEFLPDGGGEPGIPPHHNDLQRQLLQIEKNVIVDALRRNKGNISHTAEEIGYKRSKLQYRMTVLEIDLNRLEAEGEASP